MRVARILGGFGKLLIWMGSIVLLFVAYQLWGTNIAEARAQNDLESEFGELLSDSSSTTSTTSTTTTTRPRSRSTTTSTTTTTTTTTTTPPPPPADGSAAARLVIPEIGLDKIVVEGVSRNDLEKGPGHYPDTPMPGQSGNAAIAGHRTTYGAPFHRIDELEPGDEILVTTLQGSFTYEVAGTQIVTPYDVHVVDDQGDDRLTLTSCHPKYSARERIVVSAMLVEEPAPSPPVRQVREDDNTLPTEDVPAATPELEVLDGEERGPIRPAVIWGAVTFAVWLLFYVLSRRWRRWPSYLLGAPVFALTLFVFFEAVAETLPANF